MRTGYANTSCAKTLGKKASDYMATSETFAKCPILIQFKAGDNFNRRCRVANALGVNTLSISRIALKLHCVPKFELNAEME